MGKLNIQCFTCIHNEICKLSGEYNAAIKALENVSYSPGEQGTVKIREATWFDVELKCKHKKDVSEGSGK